MRKTGILMLGVVLVLVMIGTVAAAPGSGKTVLKFTHIFPEYKDLTDRTVAMFEKEHPDIDVQVNSVPWDQIQTHLRTALAGGEAPDVSFMWPMYIKDWVDIGAAYDLRADLEANGGKWKNSFVPNLIELAHIGDGYYAVPFRSIYAVVYYNKDIYRELGLDIPRTWDELMANSEKIKKHGKYDPFVVQGKGGGWIFWWYRFMIPEFAEAKGIWEEVVNGRVPYNSDIFVKGYALIKEVYDKGYWAKGALGMSREEAQAVFAQGKAAMVLGTNAEYGYYRDNATFDLGVFLFPSVVDPPVYKLFGGADGYFVLSTSEHKKEAVEFLKFLTSEPIQKLWAEETMSTAANRNVKVDDEIMTEFVEFSQYVEPKEFWSISPKMEPFMNASFAPILEGTKTIEETVNELEALRLEAVGKQ